MTDIAGPLTHFENDWRFERTPDGGCEVDFRIDFQFKSRFIQRMAGLFFDQALRRVVARFEARAQELHGPDGRPGAAGVMGAS
mgnify:CR=1 FL=1